MSNQTRPTVVVHAKVTRFSSDARVARLAVTTEQVDEYDLPTRPTRASNSRAASFQGGSVEVDAIPAAELRAWSRRR